MASIKTFYCALKNNSKIRIILYWSIVILVSMYTFSLPAFSAKSGWYIISYFLMAALAGATFLYTILYTKFIFNKILIIPMLFVAYALVGTALYSHYFVGSDGLIGWTTLVLMLITLFVFYYAFVAINNNRIVIKSIIYAFIAFGFYFIAYYVVNRSKVNFSELKLGSYFDNVNTIGFYFSIAFSISFYIALFFKKKRELFYLIPSLMFLVLGVSTGSRAYILVVLTGILVTLFLRFKKRIWIFLLIFGVLITMFIILLNLNIEALSTIKEQFDRMLFTLFGIGNSKVDTSTVQRLVYPRYAFYLAGKNLVFGYGCNGFAVYSGIGTYAHNNYAEVICNFGIFGLFLYYASFVAPFLYSFRPKEKETHIVFLMFSIYFIRSFFGVTYYSKESYLILALCFYLTRNCKFISSVFSKNNTQCKQNYSEIKI